MPKIKGETKATVNKKRVTANKAFRAKLKAKGRKTDRAGRVLTKSPYMDKPMNSFWKEAEREQIMEALKDSGDPAAMSLVNYMIDPKEKISMSKACRECGVTLQKLNELYRNHNLAIGMIGVSSELPHILSDTAIDAKAHFELCDRCDGLGEVQRTTIINDKAKSITEACPKCRGEREIRVPGDAKARDQVFEMVGLTGKSSPLVAIQNNTITGGNLEDTLNAAQKLLIRGPIIDIDADKGD